MSLLRFIDHTKLLQYRSCVRISKASTIPIKDLHINKGKEPPLIGYYIYHLDFPSLFSSFFSFWILKSQESKCLAHPQFHHLDTYKDLKFFARFRVINILFFFHSITPKSSHIFQIIIHYLIYDISWSNNNVQCSAILINRWTRRGSIHLISTRICMILKSFNWWRNDVIWNYNILRTRNIYK